MRLERVELSRLGPRLLTTLKGLAAITRFGHLRRTELGMAVWPKASHASASQMGAALARRLLDESLAKEEQNSLGSTSLVLTNEGYKKLLEYGQPAGKPTAFSSVAGAQYFHRTLGTLYLLEKAKESEDTEVLGEYALLKGTGTLSRAHLAESFHKFPDGLVIRPASVRGYEFAGKTVDWVEVEYAYKGVAELDRIMSVAWQTGGWLDPSDTFLLDRLVFVIDTRQGHESRILSAALRSIAGKEADVAAAFLSAVYLARAHVSYPLRWGGVEEISLLDLTEHRH